MEPDIAAIGTVYEEMREIAREKLDPAWEHGQVIVLETWPGEFHWAKIPDFMDPAIREPIEEALIQQLIEQNSARVLHCLCTWNGAHPEIPSWHMRSRLIEINPENLQTLSFGWGGGEEIIVKPFSALLPPKK